MLLVLKCCITWYGSCCSYIDIELYRCKAWPSSGLKRYDKEGIERLKDSPKNRRPSELSEKTSY